MRPRRGEISVRILLKIRINRLFRREITIGAQLCRSSKRAPSGEHQVPIGRTERRRLAVIIAGRLGPTPGALIEFIQETGGVARIGPGIERLIQAGEGGRVIHQVDLQAAHVDRLDPEIAQRLHRGHRGRLGREKEAQPGDVDRPRPRPDRAGARVRPATFNQGNRWKQARGKLRRVLCGRDCCLAGHLRIGGW
jgi:hypothetical protein